MTLRHLGDPIRGFLQALGGGDCETLLRHCAPSATVLGYHASAPVPLFQWCAQNFPDRPLQQRPLSLQARPEGVVVTTLVSGPFGSIGLERPTEFEWRFALARGLIQTVEVAQRAWPIMPAPVAAALVAINLLDLDALMETFAANALVVDRSHEYSPLRAIRRWADAEVIGVRAALKVMSAETMDDTTLVTLQVDGDFDTEGLSEPPTLRVHFMVDQDKVVEVIIEQDGAG